MIFSAIVRTRFIAYHAWPNAPVEVAFLRNVHRHEFHVELSVRQQHSDRAVEYIMLRRWLDKELDAWRDKDLGARSCEMLCEQLINYAKCEGYDVEYCRIFEDGENGAEVRP
jgi:hypothetical protein